MLSEGELDGQSQLTPLLVSRGGLLPVVHGGRFAAEKKQRTPKEAKPNTENGSFRVQYRIFSQLSTNVAFTTRSSCLFVGTIKARHSIPTDRSPNAMLKRSNSMEKEALIPEKRWIGSCGTVGR